MINLLIMIMPFFAFYLRSPYIHLWLVLFTAFAIIRFRFNGSKPLLVFSMSGTLVTNIGIMIFPGPYDAMALILGFQIIAVIISIAYSFKKHLWKKDVVFFVMEPVFILVMIPTVFAGFPYGLAHNNVTNWIYAYISIQALLIFMKIFSAFAITPKKFSLSKRLNLIVSYLPHIKPSFGLQDFSVSTGVSYFYQPTHLDNVMNELKFAENMIFAEMSGKVSEKEKLKKEREKLIGDATGFSRFMKSLSN